MTLTFYNLKGFKDLKIEKDQCKEIFFIYGVCVSGFAQLDDYFIVKLKHNKYIFEGEQIGRSYTQTEISKIESHYSAKATLGMLINEFKEKFNTDTFDRLFDELLRVRNLIVHSYMKLNFKELAFKELREEIYDDLLYVFNFLNEFDMRVAKQWFFTRKNSSYGIRWKGNHQGEQSQS